MRSLGVSDFSAAMSAVVGASGARASVRRPDGVICTDARRRSAKSTARSTNLCACSRSTTSATELRSVTVRAASSLSERLPSFGSCCSTKSCAALRPETACVRWAFKRSARTSRRIEVSAEPIGSSPFRELTSEGKVKYRPSESNESNERRPASARAPVRCARRRSKAVSADGDQRKGDNLGEPPYSIRRGRLVRDKEAIFPKRCVRHRTAEDGSRLGTPCDGCDRNTASFRQHATRIAVRSRTGLG